MIHTYVATFANNYYCRVLPWASGHFHITVVMVPLGENVHIAMATPGNTNNVVDTVGKYTQSSGY